MRASDSSTTTVIVNPGAGGVASSSKLSETLDPLWPARVVETDGPGHARLLAGEAVRSGAARIVVVGGDGTLHEVVNGLGASPSCALGIIPAGTGNDTARSLDIPLAHQEAVLLIVEGEARPTDLISVEVDREQEYAINAACGGFGGEVNERMTDELKERWGPLSYIRSAGDALANIPVYLVRVRVDGGEEEELAVLSLVVANGPFAARGVCVAPGAQPDDGRLSVHAVLQAPIMELLAIVPGVLKEEVPESDHYRVWSGTRVDVSSDDVLDVSIDGELRSGQRFGYEAIRGGLRVYRPS